jgi:hypothetical protein
MAYIEPIIRRKFSQPDRAAIEEQVCLAVEGDPERFLTAYCLDSRSFQGRYVNSDLMKEMFPEYNTSKEHRDRYNLPVHNAAAVLAAAQFRAAIADYSIPKRTNALFLTGVPGAGKTTAVLANRDQFPQDARILYEGQLSDPVHALPKFEAALGRGLDVEIVAIHVLSEQALSNTIVRFEREGRGATIEALARIQGFLPGGLSQIYRRFGNEVGFSVVDKRDMMKVARLRGWETLSLLESEGNYEHIKRKLTEILEAHYAANLISAGAYQQAYGQAPPTFDRSVHQEGS